MKTTLEMDGLFSQEDIINKDIIFLQCRKCSKWTKTNIHTKNNVCECGSINFDLQSATSLRTFNPKNKRKVK